MAGVRQLLDTGAPVDQRDGQGCTALHWAADRGAENVWMQDMIEDAWISALIADKNSNGNSGDRVSVVTRS